MTQYSTNQKIAIATLVLGGFFGIMSLLAGNLLFSSDISISPELMARIVVIEAVFLSLIYVLVFLQFIFNSK